MHAASPRPHPTYQVFALMLLRPSRPTLSPSRFFFNDAAPTEIYTLPLPDALPICQAQAGPHAAHGHRGAAAHAPQHHRSEEHTSELQSPDHLVCRLLLEKKKEHTSQQTTLSALHATNALCVYL